MNEDMKIGISIMKIEEKLDSGPVLVLKEFDLDRETTFVLGDLRFFEQY